MTRLVFLDTETTSLDRRKRRIWDLAYIIRDPEQGMDDLERQFFFWTDLRDADPMSLRIGRYYEKHPDPFGLGDTSEFPHAWNVMRQVAVDFMDAIIVGAVPSFDEETLAREFRRCRVQTTWHYHLQCVETFALGYLAAKGDPIKEFPFSSDEISRRVGVEPPGPDQRHTALGDARWARDMWDRIMSG